MLEERRGFKPRFAVEDICVLAREYRYLDDTEVRAAGRRASERGYLTREELMLIGCWKTRNRQRANLARNDETAVRDATTTAFRPDTPARERLQALRRLHGVQAPVASAVLHFVDSDRWSIIDFRILEALGVEKPGYYSLEFWEDFQIACGELAAEAGVDRRCFDKAGFVWSKIFGTQQDEIMDEEPATGEG